MRRRRESGRLGLEEERMPEHTSVRAGVVEDRTVRRAAS